MPYQRHYVAPEVLLAHHGVIVYHTYKDNDADQRLLYHYTTSPTDPDAYAFDVRELPTWQAPPAPPLVRLDDSLALRVQKAPAGDASHQTNPDQAAILQAICDAIDRHLLPAPTRPVPGTRALTFFPLEVIQGNHRVRWEWIGEGWCDDYDPTDPEDEPLLHFTCSERNPQGLWQPMQDASYCTRIPLTASRRILLTATASILDALEQPNSARRLEELSWLEPADF